MNTLKQCSEKERDYFAYQAQQNYLRQQSTMEEERQEKQATLQEKQAAMQEAEIALREKQAALAEIERLKALLAEKGGNGA